MRFEPIAPHTLPSDAYLAVDRRLLPGDELETARTEVEAAIGDLAPFQVDVRTGVHMWPSLIERDHPGVRGLAAAHRAATGSEPQLVHRKSTFDTGGPASLGVPTVQYGASGGDWPMGDDYVAVRDMAVEARTLAAFVADYLGG
jgi:acetylornithine deacetylase/succinyl-diaminopimelate desuccinylase-like protein